MSFFSRLKLTPKYSIEANHGELEQGVTRRDELILVPENKLEPIVELSKNISLLLDTKIDISSNCDSPDTSIDLLLYGSNSFASERIVIAHGFYVSIHKDNTDVMNLFMERVRDEPLRVAQISADDVINFANKKNKKYTKTEAMLFPGVHDIKPEDGEWLLEFYFLSKLVF